uniref:Copia protein n=1 Tax=Cajanus cajan TaxID=3821 RepID=A0A151QQ28_CAJCA|nr:Copia protein [Cajanus cajan]
MHEEWKNAMKEELAMINKNGTWELTSKPKDKHVIGVKWVYRTKLNPDGSIQKHKARLVVKGYSQMAGIDYGDTFTSVARPETIRLIVALAAQYGWKIFHLDVKSAFLNGVL